VERRLVRKISPQVSRHLSTRIRRRGGPLARADRLDKGTSGGIK
jgi:hypothetical protein